MLRFVPTWTTAAGLLLTTNEDDYVDARLEARDIAVVQAESGQQTFTLPSAYEVVTTVTVDGNPVAYTVVGSTLSLAAPLTANRVVEVVRAAPLRFSLLNGELPPGVVLRPDGSLYGRAPNVPNGQPTTFRFTARVTGTAKRDRTFSLTIAPVPEAPLWNIDALPAETTDDDLGVSYRHIATLRRGQGFAYALDAVDPDAEPVIARVTGVAGLDADDVFNGELPVGIQFFSDRRLFYGVVSPDSVPGRYFLAVELVGSATPLVLMIEVLAALEETVAAPIVVVWETPPGLLGTVTEAYPCSLSVRASATDASQPVTYGLSPQSGPLPPGITLDATTGDLIGVASRVDRPLNYPVIVRASVGSAFVDLAVTIRVEPVFASDVLDMYLRLQNIHRVPWLNRYRSIIPVDAVYRPDDSGFGIIAEPCIHLVRGLDATGDAAAALMGASGTPGAWSADHHTPVSLVLGRHRITQVVDAGGTVIYEMLYREIADPQARAGGFSRTAGGAVTRTPVAYPQSGSLYVFPNSLGNIRADLVADLGFATNDPEKRYRLENGIEPLPLWMRDGFVPALPIAHIKPGMGDAVLAVINNDDGFEDDGFVLGFDRYYVHAANYVHTRFDDGPVRAVPFSVPAGINRVELGRWAAGLAMVVARTSLHDEVWEEGTDFTLIGDALVFAPTMVGRILVALCEGDPSGDPASNATMGTNIPMGVAFGNADRMLVNGVHREYSIVSDHAVVTTPFADGDEVVFVMKDTRFDEAFEAAVRFDVMPVEVSKYYKLKDVPTA